MQRRAIAGATLILSWLRSQEGHGWQQRWENANPDDTLDWVTDLIVDDPRSVSTARKDVLDGLICLLLVRFVLPSHRFLRSCCSQTLYRKARATFRPDLFERAEQNADRLGLRKFQRDQAIVALTVIVLHSGRNLDEATFDDFMNLRYAVGRPGGQTRAGISMGWHLARGIAKIPDAPFHTMRMRGQLSTAEIVDSFHLACRPVRDVIGRYMDERRPALDYSTFSNLARIVAGFWADLEAHHPGIDSLHLPEDVAEA
jgi:hypothetical protein